jgi:antirestriction protein ArdC
MLWNEVQLFSAVTPTATGMWTLFQATFHEIVHAAGHKDRLARNLSTRFGSNADALKNLWLRWAQRS